MKKAIALFLALVMVFALCGCEKPNLSSDSFAEGDSEDSTAIEIVDNGEHENEIQELLTDWGNVRWDSVNEYYVVSPRGNYLKVIKFLVENPANEEYLEYWDKISNVIAGMSGLYNCAICVANPADNTKMLLVTGFGDILTSVW